jgi:hypothetical protein
MNAGSAGGDEHPVGERRLALKLDGYDVLRFRIFQSP